MSKIFKNINKIFTKDLFPNFKFIYIVFFFIFTLGLLFMITNRQKPLFESFGVINSCPNILIQKGKKNYFILHLN